MSHKIQPEINLRALDRSLRKSSEWWWTVTNAAQFAVFLVGLAAIFLSVLSRVAPFLLAGLTIISEICRFRFSNMRGTWEKLHRELDAQDSLDWPISKSEISDLLTTISRKHQSQLILKSAKDDYFDSNLSPGPRRTVKNMQESAWWAKHLARRAASIYATIITVLIIGSFAALIITITTAPAYTAQINISRAVTSTIMLIFSLNLIRTAFSYYSYSQKATEIEERAKHLLSIKNKKIHLTEAIKLMQDYHLAHAEAPMNPGWLWTIMQENLNELWKKYRHDE